MNSTSPWSIKLSPNLDGKLLRCYIVKKKIIPLSSPSQKKLKSTSIKQNSSTRALYISELIFANTPKSVQCSSWHIRCDICLKSLLIEESVGKILVYECKKRHTSFVATVHIIFTEFSEEAEHSWCIIWIHFFTK